MQIKKVVYFLSFVLCFLNIHGKSIENEEEKTNEINETVEAEVSTVEPEAGPVFVAVSTDQETTESSETTEPATTTEPTTREPEQCNPDSYCEYQYYLNTLIHTYPEMGDSQMFVVTDLCIVNLHWYRSPCKVILYFLLWVWILPKQKLISLD